jgi:threonine synthase
MRSDRIEVFAPGCIGNIGPGLDVLGLAVTGPGDTIVAELVGSAGISIADPGHPSLPADAARHTAGIAARAVLERAGQSRQGIQLRVHKGLPLSGGQGGSAASAVAAAVAVNQLLGSPLGRDELLAACLIAEESVAGRHLDNIAPSLLGGAALIRSVDPIDVVSLPINDELVIVLAHPEQQLETRRGRAALPHSIEREVALHQAAQVAAIVAAFSAGDWKLLGRAIDDRIAEPARAPLLPGFVAAKAAAIEAGALGCSISGSGPTAFAFAADEPGATTIARAMERAYQSQGIRCQARIARVDRVGARVVSSDNTKVTSAGFAASMSATVQRCRNCGKQLDETAAVSRCSCGGLLELKHPRPELTGPALARLFASRRRESNSGVWRYKELVLPGASDLVTSAEGNTPLLSRSSIARWSGVDGLLLKHEGHNPTGSFKDRGMTVGVTQAVRIGARAVACASTGNTSASLAAYAAQAGIPALVLVPAGQVAAGKLAQSLAYGARTLLVRGDFDSCLRLVREAESSLGVYLLNSINPFRIEGQKTIILELLEQLGWRSPEWIVFPAGNLGNTAAFGKALVEARELDLIQRLPRLAAIQAAGAAPFYQSFLEGFSRPWQVKAETIATAIRIGDPASYDRAVRSIRDTDGVVEAVTDEEILEAKAVVDCAGIGCEPASAASVAGVKKLVRTGVIQPGETVIAVLTGHILKDPATTGRENKPIEIEANVSEVERAMSKSN